MAYHRKIGEGAQPRSPAYPGAREGEELLPCKREIELCSALCRGIDFHHPNGIASRPGKLVSLFSLSLSASRLSLVATANALWSSTALSVYLSELELLAPHQTMKESSVSGSGGGPPSLLLLGSLMPDDDDVIPTTWPHDEESRRRLRFLSVGVSPWSVIRRQSLTLLIGTSSVNLCVRPKSNFFATALNGIFLEGKKTSAGDSIHNTSSLFTFLQYVYIANINKRQASRSSCRVHGDPEVVGAQKETMGG